MSVAGVQQPQGTEAVWDEVLELTKSAQDRGMDPLMWAMQLSSVLSSAGVSMPSPEMANILVSHICWSNNVPLAWKFLEKALTLRVAPPLLVLALLSVRVLPDRKRQPVAYRLYMELIKRYFFSLPSLINGPNYPKIMLSIDNVLQLSQVFGLQAFEPGHIIVEFVFSTVWGLLDASLADEGLLDMTNQKISRWLNSNADMEVDTHDSIEAKKAGHHDVLQKLNTALAVEIIGDFLRDKVTSKILYLVQRNMPADWESFMKHLRLLIGKSAALRSSKCISPESLLELMSKTNRVPSQEWKTRREQRFHAVMASGSLISSSSQGTSPSAPWLPIDLFLEDSMDKSQVAATSTVELLTGLLKSLQAFNQTTWQDTFLGLWISALRLVQRERDSSEGPVPRIDTCLCMLLSITPLAIANIIDEEETALAADDDGCFTGSEVEKQPFGRRRHDLVASLQRLVDYDGLLTPPTSASSLANQAATKAMMFLSGLSVGSGYFDGISLNDMQNSSSGSLRHLIVEACIARNLLDTSAYLWPGYVKSRANQIPRNLSGQTPGWSSLVKGSVITPPMMSVLVSTPASSLAEIEKIYEIAISGSDDEKICAATILCGASLVRGWNIQELTVLFITRLLAPPVPVDYSGTESHLIGYAPFLNVLLVGISPVDCIQIFSLHGLVPQLVGSLLPICEAFGSRAPNISWNLPTGETICPLAVFSNAFTLLLKLWRFDHPPLEHVSGDVAPVGSHLTPEYLLLVRNSQLSSSEDTSKGKFRSNKFLQLSKPSLREPIFLDTFPKLKRWYRQHQACIASTLSGLVPGTPVHQIVDALLAMIFRRINRGSQPMTPGTSGSSSSSGNGLEDLSFHLKLPAWDILEAVPFVLDAALTACGHGTLSPRELATGLKDLADFLPASLATVVSYFSAEVTRGLWKPVFMNGSDWPSPAANLSNVEQQIKQILAATGVDIPCLSVGGSSPVTLPLPLAAFVSLTITYKLDKATDRFLNLVGPSLSSLAAGCPWPCMPIIASLWAQKVKRWSDFLVYSASRTVFHHNSDAVVQLLRVCFSTTLGLNSSSISSNSGVGGLLGHGFGSHLSGGIRPVAPGILYLRVHRSVRNVMFMTEEILSLLLHSVKDIVSSGFPTENLSRLRKSRSGMKYGQVSLAAAMSRVKLAASLGASIVWITGGSNLIQSLIKETLPSWFISGQGSVSNSKDMGGMVSMLGGYALAYFSVLCGTFAWGVDATSPASARRSKILGYHIGFLVGALDGKISLGCNRATWRAYVSGFVSLLVACTPAWMQDVDVSRLKKLSRALKRWNEEELALALLGVSGVNAMGAAAELIIETEF